MDFLNEDGLWVTRIQSLKSAQRICAYEEVRALVTHNVGKSLNKGIKFSRKNAVSLVQTIFAYNIVTIKKAIRIPLALRTIRVDDFGVCEILQDGRENSPVD